MDTTEEWKEVEETNGLYLISSLGRLKRKRRYIERKSKGYFCQEKLIAVCDNGNGYKQFMVQVNQKRKVFYVHRLVAKYFIPNPKKLPEVNHKDLDRSNNKKSNLEWVTRLENIDHYINSDKKSNGKSGYFGVKRADSKSEKWQARITVNKKEIYLGVFDTKEEAVEARNNYIISNNLNRKLQQLKWKEFSEELPKDKQNIIIYDDGLKKELYRIFYIDFWNQENRVPFCSSFCKKWKPNNKKNDQ